MRHWLPVVLLAGFLTTFATTAPAQERRWGSYAPDRVSALIDRVHEDLNRGYGSGWHFNKHDRNRLNDAEHELRDFAERWGRGKFDKGELDDAIASIQHVVNNNHMSGRERDELWRDLGALRRMREAYDRHEIGRY